MRDQIDSLISDLEGILINADNEEDTRYIDDALDGLKDADRALGSILNYRPTALGGLYKTQKQYE